MALPDHCNVDVVIDACVLDHSCHSWGVLAETSTSILDDLREHDSLIWLLDDTGGTAPALETSRIATEYVQTLGPASAPLALLSMLAQFGRVSFVGKPDEAVRKTIRKIVPHNAGDRILLGTAAMSSDHLLVSNDEEDFTEAAREAAAKTLGVRIVWSYEVAS